MGPIYERLSEKEKLLVPSNYYPKKEPERFLYNIFCQANCGASNGLLTYRIFENNKNFPPDYLPLAGILEIHIYLA